MRHRVNSSIREAVVMKIEASETGRFDEKVLAPECGFLLQTCVQVLDIPSRALLAYALVML